MQPPAVKTPAGQAAVQEKGDKPLRERHCEREDPPRRRGAPLGRKSAIAVRCEKAGGIRSRETPAQRESGDLHRGGSHSGGRILRRADSVCHLPAVPAGAADFFGAPAPHGFFIREELYYEFV